MTLFDRTGDLTHRTGPLTGGEESRPGAIGFDPMTPTTFDIELDPSWSSLRGTHGGYLASLAVRAAERVTDGRSVRTVTTSFLRPGHSGPAELTIMPERLGRSLSTHVATITQDGRGVATSRVTTMVVVDGIEWDAPEPERIAAVPECVPLDPPEGVRHFAHATAVLDPTHLPFTHGPLARVAGHVRPLEPRPIDAAWLTMILDWFPPSPFSHVDPPTGGVSVDYTVHLHRTLDRLRDGEWLTGAFRADVSSNSMALEKGVIRDATGHVLAESFHTRWSARTIS